MSASTTSLDLPRLCQDLHAHPELSFQETRTAAIVAEQLRAFGYETTAGVGGTGVVGVLRNGTGGTALLRADMDALPVLEQTGLAYASTVRGVDGAGNDVPDVVLGQHVAPLPAGFLGLQLGTAFAASDSLKVTLFGRGGHGSRPEATIDPVVMAAATVLRLQTVVSCEIAGNEMAVVTVGRCGPGRRRTSFPTRRNC